MLSRSLYAFVTLIHGLVPWPLLNGIALRLMHNGVCLRSFPPGMAPPLPPQPHEIPSCRPLRVLGVVLPCMVPCSRPRAVVVLVVPVLGLEA